MRVQFCCETMRRLILDDMIEFDAKGFCMEGEYIHFCPYCGEKIEVIPVEVKE